MAAKHQRHAEIPVSPEAATHRLAQALQALPRSRRLTVAPPWVTVKIGMSLWSWGESVTAHVQTVPGRGCFVTVRSVSAINLVDWGINRRNVETVLSWIMPAAAPNAQRSY